MSGRHQPANGADSAEALRDIAGDLWYEREGWLSLPTCAACSLPAVDNGYCTGHARLFEYTDHERFGGIAANE